MIERDELIKRLVDYIRLEIKTKHIKPHEPIAIAWRDLIERYDFYHNVPGAELRDELADISDMFYAEDLSFHLPAILGKTQQNLPKPTKTSNKP
jgi:hypothetical protein